MLDALEVAVDAAADAVNAEGAFQMVRGNFARAAASLDAISSGQAPPPELGFMATPRTGTGLTHRVAMLLPAAGGANPPAGPTGSSPRARPTRRSTPGPAACSAPRPASPHRSIVRRRVGATRRTARVLSGSRRSTSSGRPRAPTGVPPEIAARMLAAAGAASGQRRSVARGRRARRPRRAGHPRAAAARRRAPAGRRRPAAAARRAGPRARPRRVRDAGAPPRSRRWPRRTTR